MLVDSNHHFFRRKAQFLRGRVENTGICLVWDDPVDVGGTESCVGQDFGEHVGKVVHGMAKHFSALHPELSNCSGSGRAAVDEKEVVVTAIGMQFGREDAAICLFDTQHQSSGAITE